MRKSFVVITDTHIRVPGKHKDGAFWNKTLLSRGPDIIEAWLPLDAEMTGI